MGETVYHRIKASVPAQWFFRYTGVGPLRTYIRWFGFSEALRILWHKWISSAEPISIHPPSLKAPIFLRAATSDPHVYAEVLHDGIYQTDLPPSPRLIIDAGANIGMASVFFSNRFPDATVIAIEPADSNMALLRRNVAPYPNVHPKLAGLWPTPGPLRLVNPEAEPWGMQVEPCRPEEADFQGITIPQILAENSAQRVDVLKIDIEGAEWPLFFDTPPDWLQSVNFLTIELHSQPGRSFDQFVRLMEQYNLRLLHSVCGSYIFSR